MPDDQHDPKLDQPPAQPPATGKPRRAANRRAIAKERKLRERMVAILTGMTKTKREALFVGPIDADLLRALLTEHEHAEKENKRVRKAATHGSSRIRNADDAANSVLTVLLGLVDVYYPAGSPGRGAFYDQTPGAKSLTVQLEHALAGLQQDRARGQDADKKGKQPERPLLPDVPACNVAHVQEVLAELHAAHRHPIPTQGDLDSQANALENAERRLQDAVTSCTKMLKLVLGDTSAELSHFGLVTRRVRRRR